MKTYKVNFLVQNREVAADGWHTMHYYLKRLLYRHLYLYLTHSNLYFQKPWHITSLYQNCEISKNENQSSLLLLISYFAMQF